MRRLFRFHLPCYAGFYKKSPGSLEYVNYPGKLALDIWEYVIAAGAAGCAAGVKVQVGSTRHGYLLHYVYRGELVHVIGGKRHPVGAGSVCLMDFSKAHRILNERSVAAELWWLHFGGKDMSRLFSELDATRQPVFDSLNRGNIEKYFRELWALIGKQPLAYEAKTHVALSAILAELLASRAQPPGVPSLVPQKAPLSEQVRLAVRRFERIYHLPLSLKETASILGVDMYHFARMFRREVGMAPMQYLNRYRIAQARHLLSTTDKAVSQIAPLVGIRDPDYFARLFRKITGKTPRAFRKTQTKA